MPPEPALMLGQTRTTTPASPVQLAESVAVMSSAVFSVRSTVAKLRFVIENPQLMGAACVGNGQATIAAPARVPNANCRMAGRRLIWHTTGPTRTWLSLSGVNGKVARHSPPSVVTSTVFVAPSPLR